MSNKEWLLNHVSNNYEGISAISIVDNVTWKTVYKNGNVDHYTNQQLHRYNDLPAVELASGYCAWYSGGHRHRVGAPAVIYSDGTAEYWYCGRKLDASEGTMLVDWSEYPDYTRTSE